LIGINQGRVKVAIMRFDGGREEGSMTS